MSPGWIPTCVTLTKTRNSHSLPYLERLILTKSKKGHIQYTERSVELLKQDKIDNQ